MKKKKIGLMDILIFIFCGIFALLCLYPIYYVLINTISDNRLVSGGKIMLYPRGIHFENYRQVAQLQGLPQAAFISVARTVVGTFFAVISSSFLGYVMTKKEYWHRKFWYRFLLITMYFNSGIIPWYLLMTSLKLTNNFWGYVLPALASPFYMILAKTYIESLPASLEESAEIDGAGYLVRYFRLIIPLAKPILATIAIFAAVGQWNSFMDTVYLMTDKKFYTLQFILYRFLHETDRIAEAMKRGAATSTAASLSTQLTPAGVQFTVTIVTILPILLVYPFFQRYFVKGIMIGAVKG